MCHVGGVLLALVAAGLTDFGAFLQQVRRVLDEIVARVNAPAYPLPTTYEA